MNDGVDVAVIAAVSFVFGVVAGLVVMQGIQQSSAIQHNCAKYNPQSGEFMWLKGDK